MGVYGGLICLIYYPAGLNPIIITGFFLQTDNTPLLQTDNTGLLIAQ